MISSQAVFLRGDRAGCASPVPWPHGCGPPPGRVGGGVTRVREFTCIHRVSVGDECGDSVAVESVKFSCAPGWAFLAQDQLSDRPCAHVDQVGGLSDPGALADAVIGLDRRIPALALVEDLGGIADPDIDGVAEGEPHPGGATVLGEGVGGASGIAAHQDLGCQDRRVGRYCGGSDSIAEPSTLTWSAAALSCVSAQQLVQPLRAIVAS